MDFYDKLIVVLANSRKPRGRCIAGKSIEANATDWIRPVSTRDDGELWASERQYERNQEPSLLDVVHIRLARKGIHSFQHENHIVHKGFKWRKIKMISYNRALRLQDTVEGDLWSNVSSSSNGVRDKIHVSEVQRFSNSLLLIKVTDLVAGAQHEATGLKVRGTFTFNHQLYRLAVTDPVFEARTLQSSHRRLDVGEALICLSLGEPFNGYVYKLIAGVICP